MTTTLLKHEWLRTRGALGMYFGITVLVGLLGSLLGASGWSVLSVLGLLLAFLAVLVLVPGVQLLLVADYWRSGYGRTGYFTQSIPVRGATIFRAKLLWAVLVSLAAAMCFLVSMASASQDIALDALRREILKDNELGLGNSLFVNLYRLSQLVPGSLAFILADHIPWSMVYLITGLFMIPGLLATLFVVKEPQIAAGKRTFREAVSLPLKEFVSRKGVRHALLVLLFIFCYKLGDSMATSLLTRFYLDKGFTRTAIGILSKSVSLPMSVIGALLGGIWMLKIGINRALWLFGLFQFITILIFILLDMYPTKTVLSLVIGAEAFGVGLGTCAFTSYLARETNPAYTAFQFALFTSLAAVPRTFFNAACGYLQALLGWSGFYYVCAIIAVPGMLLLLKVAPWNGGSDLESERQNS